MESSIQKLQDYIENQDYKGWDPYDILKSPIFKIPVLNKNKALRFYSQQFGKRFPLNIRPLLRVPKGCNPVTLGLCIQAYSYLIVSYPKRKEELTVKILDLIYRLKLLIPAGFSGACWGYDFDWEARNASIPGYQPTVVATGIITNALFECFRITKIQEAFDLCESASNFVVYDLNITGDICFSYSPTDNQQVFNASMKGARLISQVYSITKDEFLLSKAERAVRFVCTYQKADGSWPYSLAQKGTWVDNYHTGYVLDCIHEYTRCTGDSQFSKNLAHGFNYYENNFFENGIRPKFYNHSLYPIDCTAASQSILSLCRFGNIIKAKDVSAYIIKSMQKTEGSFSFRKHKYYTQRTSFMRWSNAWMFVALAYLIYNERNR